MQKYLNVRIACILISLSISPIYQAYGADTIINNYNSAPAQAPNQAPPQSACGNNNYGTSGNGMPPGSYTIRNSDGTSNQIYTTGDKQPYIVDNNCNQAPVIQPYVEAQMPGPPGPGPGPDPRPR